MAHLTELQIEKIKEHMLHEEDALESKFKAKSLQFDKIKVLHSEVNHYENQGWMVDAQMKTRTSMTRPKEHTRQFEDDVWCMFYRLGFRILNSDDKLRVHWGNNQGEDKQIDVLAVGDDAIFVVECKSAENPKKQSFQQALIEMSAYQKGMTESLQQIYGKTKRVKFIFATRNYRIESDSEDANRMRNNGIYHLNDSAYNYICNLIKSYKSSVVYQFHSLMFKDELINEESIVIPALRGIMGGRDYYLFSIEPSTLLKIGFVLHRTKVNDSMAPTYQRLLVPKRLNGITKFINEGGYFPNSIILNFTEPNQNIKVQFDPIHKEDASNAEFGLLRIPNAYGIAYIIDGQHRVYGYSNSKHKDTHTIPVVAFQNMLSEEQLKIFMEINENQKAVSKNLRQDLELDLFWTSPRLDSRMKALRTSIIHTLNEEASSVLFNKISIGEDQALLSSVFFDNGLRHSGLIPKASQTKWTGNTDSCLYDVTETNIDKEMNDSGKRISQFLNLCYELADDNMGNEIKDIYLFSNRATYTFITLMGHLHAYLFACGEISTKLNIKERVSKMTPYIKVLCDGLNNIPEEDSQYLRSIQGQGAEKRWLLYYQDIINRTYPEYFPEELKEWKEMRDQSVQEEGEKLKSEIREFVKMLVFLKLQEVHGNAYEKHIGKIKNACLSKIYETYGDNEDFDIDDYNWMDVVEIPEYKHLIDINYAHDLISSTFGIALTDKATSKKDKLNWISLIDKPVGRRRTAMTRSDVNRLWLIRNHLSKFVPTED